MKQRIWVTPPIQMPFPYVIIGTDPIQGTLIEVDFPEAEPEYTLKDLKADVKKIKDKLGVT